MFIPGVDMALVTRQVIKHGRRSTFATLGGLLLGGLLHAAFATAGLSAVLLVSAGAYTAVKIMGAVYLVALGIATIWGSRKLGSKETAEAEYSPNADRRPMSLRRAFLLGLLSDLTNPKVAVFFLTFLPQFVSAGDDTTVQMAVLGILFNVIATSWWIGYVLVMDRVAVWFRRGAVRRAFERVSGAVLIALGVRLAIERR